MSDFDEVRDMLTDELDAAEDLFRAALEDKIRFGEISQDDLRNMLKICDDWSPEGVQVFQQHILSKNLCELSDIFDEIMNE
ncbi:hypothetical protein OA249_03165 [Litorivicinus sp.]|nr:hypothetical protein [Litorivicinus sp.]